MHVASLKANKLPFSPGASLMSKQKQKEKLWIFKTRLAKFIGTYGIQSYQKNPISMVPFSRPLRPNEVDVSESEFLEIKFIGTYPTLLYIIICFGYIFC